MESLAAEYAPRAVHSWAQSDPSWGIWESLRSELGLLADVAGKDVLEDGCGTAYVSAWMKRRGAAPVGLDNSPPNWRRRGGCSASTIFTFRSFTVRQRHCPSRRRASTWSSPNTEPRSGPTLTCGFPRRAVCSARVESSFTSATGLFSWPACRRLDADLPAKHELLRDYFGMHRFEWPDDESVEFHLGYGDWIRLFRSHDLEVLDLLELRPSAGAETVYDFVSAEWARRWPAEQVWRVRKR